MNQTDHSSRGNRREFMRSGVRYAVLTSLAAVATLLVKRNGGKLTGQTCINQSVCSGCGAFGNCGLPAALSAKQFQSRRSRRAETQTSIPERGVHAASTSPAQIAPKRAEARVPKTT